VFRLTKPGVRNNQLTPMIAKVAEAYECTPVEGVLSHEVKRHFIDGNKVIINRETAE
jgi:methionine aminopeptidase